MAGRLGPSRVSAAVPWRPQLARAVARDLGPAACRSAEGRRRVVAEIVKTLGCQEDGGGAAHGGKRTPAMAAPSLPPAAAAGIPFVATPGGPPPYKVRG